MSSYVTLAELRAWIRLSDSVTDSDPKLEACITAAEAFVDAHCGRTFVPTAEDAVAEARIFQSDRVDDFSTVSGLIVETSLDRITWQTRTIDTEFWVGPDSTSAFADAFWQINPLPYVDWCGRFIRVTAKWGWPAVPEPVKLSTKIVAHLLVKRSGDPYAVAQIGDMPSRVRRDDPQVIAALAPYRRMDRVAV